jgi:Ser/Thr protein kinase RdoA (MazF antagonist)
MGDDDGGPGLDGQGPRFLDLLDPTGARGRPVAAPLVAVAELLGEPLARVRAAAARVEPYQHAAGHPVWSVMLVERELGRRRPTGPGSAWRGQRVAGPR